MQLEGITALANGATRLRLAGSAVIGLGITYPDTAPEVADPALDGPIAALRGPDQRDHRRGTPNWPTCSTAYVTRRRR